MQGIAHFCEHMVFMGSENYKEPGTFQRFVTSEGGTYNAATGEDFTFFFFDIQNKSLDKGLSIFSDFFKNPIFSEEATETEIN